MNQTPGTPDAQPNLRATAAELDAAGLCVLPVKGNGTKQPDVRSWMQYKVARSTPEEHDQWFGDGRRTGIGIVTGAVSGNIELIEFEGLAVEEGVLDEVTELANNSGLGDLWLAVTTGWADQSPSGGVHYKVIVEGRPATPNTKLARRLAREDEYTPEERQRVAEKPNSKIIRVLIETRGEGGFVVIAPSHGTVHPSGKPYVRLAGGPSTMATVGPDELEAIYALCRAVDAMPTEERAKTAPPPKRELPSDFIRPGDDFEDRATWEEIIGGEFDPIFNRGRTTYWRRKGKKMGISATTGRAADRDRLYVFSTSTTFDAEVPYNKFAAYTHLTQGGTHAEAFKQAAADLRARGYGTQPRSRPAQPPASRRTFSDGSSALDVEPDQDTERPEAAPRLQLVVSRPELDISNEPEAIEGVLALMADERLPDMYKRAGGPTWVHSDDMGDPVMQQLGTDNLRAYLAEHVDSYQMVRNPLTELTEPVRELLAPKTCSTILGRKEWPLPPLRGIVTSPVVRPDGTLIQAPGYDRATGLYLHPRVPVRRLGPLDEAQVRRAKQVVLDQMLNDFPWVEDSDRAHFLGALLTPILRPYFHGPTPMFIISATTQGSGKTLLKDILAYCYGVSDTAWPENDTELRKSITTQLYTSGQPIIVLDNLPNGHVIKSPVLSSVLTAETWGDRILGATSAVRMPNDRVWIVTGNGLRTGGDNARRALWVRLDPQCPDPDQRDGFAVGDLRPWLRGNASTVVASLVTMVRSWLAAGSPSIRTRKGDYSEWASMLAGLLDHLGVPGWMADRDRTMEQDDEMVEWAAFLIAWREAIPNGAAVTTSTILKSVGDAVPKHPKSGDAPTAATLGHWLKARDGRFFGRLKPVRVYDSHKCQNLWRVEEARDKGAAL
ncbi:bifunctional DNA primase/polymerase [Streptomyces sp. NPDC020983]|uniref:bifunctional DNA primase/polymerase n=1 Tax=Streptomyces sp. NPDC020983 TaxID=3365106 RepID=UPI0037984E0C